MNCPKCKKPIDGKDYENLDVGFEGALIHKSCPQPVEEIKPYSEEVLNDVTVNRIPADNAPLVKVVEDKTLSNSIAFPPLEKDEPLTRQQEVNVAILSYGQAVAGDSYSPDIIVRLWPEHDPRAGKKPSITAIRQFQATDTFRIEMAKRGVRVHPNQELSAEQLALLSIITDPTDTRSLNSKLRSAGIKSTTYRAWLRQAPFQERLRKLAGSALTEAIPIAEAQLAAQASSGDLKALKFLFEVTGRHDPARQQAVDTQALIGVIIDVMQETIRDPELLQEIQQKIKFRAQGVKGVIK